MMSVDQTKFEEATMKNGGHFVKNQVVTNFSAFLILRNFVNSLHWKFSTVTE